MLICYEVARTKNCCNILWLMRGQQGGWCAGWNSCTGLRLPTPALKDTQSVLSLTVSCEGNSWNNFAVSQVKGTCVTSIFTQWLGSISYISPLNLSCPRLCCVARGYNRKEKSRTFLSQLFSRFLPFIFMLISFFFLIFLCRRKDSVRLLSENAVWCEYTQIRMISAKRHADLGNNLNTCIFHIFPFIRHIIMVQQHALIVSLAILPLPTIIISYMFRPFLGRHQGEKM